MFGLFGKKKEEQLKEQHEAEQALHERKLSAQERFDEILEQLPLANNAIKEAQKSGKGFLADELRKERADMMEEFESIKKRL